ncbi:MAG: radical SAM protein [Deltaproteobacteria bacterium]|nr:radical SAM protein [Deltaproteobacteria bacterium]
MMNRTKPGGGGTVSFLVTTSCQNRCVFCFEQGACPSGDMLSYEFIASRLDELGGRVKKVDLAGGEPMTHPKIHEIAKLIKDRMLGLTVTTNGLALADRREAEWLCGVADRIVLSIHAGNAEDYAWVTGNENGFAKVERAVANLADICKPGRVLVNTTVVKQTMDGLPETGKLVSRLGHARWHVTNPFPVGGASAGYKEIAPRLTRFREIVPGLVAEANSLGLDLGFSFFPTCAIGCLPGLNNDLLEPGQANGFVLDHESNPHHPGDLTFERVFSRKCRSCGLKGKACMGVAARYVEEFGEDEIQVCGRASKVNTGSTGRDYSAGKGHGNGDDIA